MKRSDWMEGLLWAEEYIERGEFFKGGDLGVKSLYWEVYHSGEFIPEYDSEFMKGIVDYMKHYEERL